VLHYFLQNAQLSDSKISEHRNWSSFFSVQKISFRTEDNLDKVHVCKMLQAN